MGLQFPTNPSVLQDGNRFCTSEFEITLYTHFRKLQTGEGAGELMFLNLIKTP